VCPVCSPTRAEFLTGRYHPRGGVFSTSAGGERLDLDESTIAEAFQAAGYATAAFGKWHNGMQAPYHPNTRGFDEFYGFCSGHWGHYFSPMLEHNGNLVRGDGFVVDDFTNHAIKFMEDHREGPFFVYLPYNIPHSPMQVPDRYWEKFAEKELTQLPGEAKKNRQSDKGVDHARAALAMCENIDDNVGRVLAKLDELKLADKTIVLYFCDNGPNGARFNAGLKGRKGSTDEGGVRSPLFVRWPGQIKAGTRIRLVTGAIDLFPTLTSLCGVAANPNKPFDGISFAPELLGAKVKRSPRNFYSHWNNKVSVRTQRYRLDNKNVLYDMIADPGQTTPVEDEPEARQELVTAAENWRKEVLAELDRSLRPFPVGHRGLAKTQLPARDATASGQIQRSNKFPNCSYFTNWIDTNDKISWPIDVVEGGKFQVEVYYGCAASDLGTTVELSFGDQSVSKKITVANDPPLIGAEQDRSVRGESLVKDFKPVKMGVIDLPPGKGELVLRAIEIPGKQSIEFRLLMLTRVE
jgi:arylsulfatase A-like enzyme